MKYLNALLPHSQNPSAQTSLKDIREQIIQYILVTAIVLGILALTANLPLAISRGEWSFVALYTFVFVLLIVIYLVKSIPHLAKALVIVAIFFVLGFTGLLESGLSGDGRILLISSTFLAAVLIGNIAGFVTLVLCFASLTFVGIGMTTGRIPLPPAAIMENSGIMGDWISGTVILVASSALVLMALLILINGLDKSLKKQSNLSQALENQSGELEKTIAQRTLDLEYRLGQLRTAAEISRLIGTNFDPQVIMDQLVALLQERFDLYYVGVFIIDDLGKNAVLKTGTGEAGRQMISQHHKLAVGGASMIGWAISNRKARIALDVGVEAIRFNNPFLPLTRSEMALPLISRDQPIGAISLQSSQGEAFDADDITVLQGIADIFATALDNARLYQDAQASLIETRNLHQRYLEEAWLQTVQSEGALSYTYEVGTPTRPAAQLNSISIPISLRDQVIGQVVLDMEQEQLSPDDLVFIDTLAAQTAQALENARLLEATQRQVSQEQLLNQMSSKFSTAYEVEDILRVAALELGKLPNVTDVSVILDAPDITVPPMTNTSGRVN